jgi:hypothetical protein
MDKIKFSVSNIGCAEQRETIRNNSAKNKNDFLNILTIRYHSRNN